MTTFRPGQPFLMSALPLLMQLDDMDCQVSSMAASAIKPEDIPEGQVDKGMATFSANIFSCDRFNVD